MRRWDWEVESRDNAEVEKTQKQGPRTQERKKAKLCKNAHEV